LIDTATNSGAIAQLARATLSARSKMPKEAVEFKQPTGSTGCTGSSDCAFNPVHPVNPVRLFVDGR